MNDDVTADSPITTPDGPANEAGSGASLHDFLVRRRDRSFLCRVSDDALAADGLRAGDMVVMERGAAPSHGCLAVVRAGDEVAVRRLSFAADGAGFSLAPPLRSRAPLEVLGVVISSFRRYAA